MAAFLCQASLVAQNSATREVFGENLLSEPRNGLVRCVSAEYENALQRTYSHRSSTADFEEWLNVMTAQRKSRLDQIANTVITIPVVVHVIHDGDAIGTFENISDDRVVSQITVLNQDFRRMLNTNGYNSNPVGADIEVEFCLASVDPNGNPTNGINRVNLNTASWATQASVEGTLKPQTQWNPDNYFNIWVCQFSSSTSAELYGILGYAQFPFGSTLAGIPGASNTAATDGVILDYRCFGSKDIVPATPNSIYYQNYDLGRTLTHEIGHSFGLRHIWGDNSACVINSTDSNKDYCPDTPAAASANYSCTTTMDSCPSIAGNDMVENYMDYTNDACMNVFTENQKDRMLTVLEYASRRSSLKNLTACAILSNDKHNFQGLYLYPNPANDFITINTNSIDINRYTIFNNLGQIVDDQKKYTVDDITIFIANLSRGVYVIRLQNEKGSKSIKFIKY